MGGRISAGILGRKSRDKASVALEEQATAKLDPSRYQTLPSKLFSNTIVWTTPLRLPVVQPYRNPKGRIFQTKLQLLSLHDPHAFDAVDRTKQTQAFPPNFIHSLDATHMHLSALKCTEIGLTFASVHDSFWTHAADVGTMSSVLRDAFVTMHSEDIIGRLSEELHARHKGHMFVRAVPRSHDASLAIIQWRSDNSARLTNHTSELRIELERASLLASQDPEEVKKGEAMVTPASIVSDFEKAGTLPFYDCDDQTLANFQGAGESTAETAANVEIPDDSLLNEVAAKKNSEAGQQPKRSWAPKKRIYLWMPTTFPPVPVKGDFDVSRLRDSRYFFH